MGILVWNWKMMRQTMFCICCFMLLAGCHATTSQTSASESNVSRPPALFSGVRKIAVVCTQPDLQTNLAVEKYLGEKFRDWNIEAVPTHELFSAEKDYRPSDMVTKLQDLGVEGVLEATYTDKPGENGLPEHINFKYHSIGRQSIPVVRYDNLNTALIALIVTLTRP
jgi:hypothetical protein